MPALERDLEWGETPWDFMDREDLLREVQRMYSAVSASADALRYLVPGAYSGTGERARRKCDQVLARVGSRDRRSEMYRAFYRYADDLLFEGLGRGWGVCDTCGALFGETADGHPSIGKPCLRGAVLGHDAVLRPLRWEDLRPEFLLSGVGDEEAQRATEWESLFPEAGEVSRVIHYRRIPALIIPILGTEGFAREAIKPSRMLPDGRWVGYGPITRTIVIFGDSLEGSPKTVSIHEETCSE